MTTSDHAFTGSIPQLYDQMLVPMIFAPYAYDLARRIAARKPRDLLETAAGTGAVTAALASALPAATRITATDLNESMLVQAKRRVGERPGLIWRQADALALPFPDASFDIVACQFGAMFFPDKVKGYAEARRVLKTGGRLIFNVWDRIEDNDFALSVHQALNQIFPDDPPRFLARTPHGYYDSARIRAELTDAGFRDITIETVAQRGRADSPADVATAFCKGTPVRGEIEDRGEPGLEVATKAVADALARKFGSSPIKGRIQALVISAA